MEKKINFIAIAESEVQKFKDSLKKTPHDEYLDIPLFVAIKEDMHIEISNDMKALEDAFECILILAFSSLAYKNYYDWYKIIYIDKNGIAQDGFNKAGWAIKYTFSGDYKTKLIYLEFKDVMLHSVTKESYMTWEEPFTEVWSVYRYAKSSETVKEARLTCKNYELLRKVDRLQKEIEELKSTNQLLEKQKMQCQSIIDEVLAIVQKQNEK